GNKTLVKSISGGFSWSGSAMTSGSNGSTSGQDFPYWSGSGRATATQLAQNVADAINRIGNGSSIGASVPNAASGGAFTVASSTPGSDGTFTTGGTASSFFWGSVTAGTDGTNTCGSSTSGTFAISSDTTVAAANLTAAINACPVAAGITATQGTGDNTNQVTITARTGGTGGNSIGSTESLSNFSWGATALSAGTD